MSSENHPLFDSSHVFSDPVIRAPVADKLHGFRRAITNSTGIGLVRGKSRSLSARSPSLTHTASLLNPQWDVVQSIRANMVANTVPEWWPIPESKPS